jgi:site-specific DNA-methyltransferase (adenine-specific)/modification methylase
MCGDSTDENDVAKLMAGEKADMVFTDPPYGLADSKTDKNNYNSYDDSLENLDKIVKSFFKIYPKISDTIVLTPGNKNQRSWPKPTWTMAWFSKGNTGLGPWGFCTWQPILCYGKDPKLKNRKGSYPDSIEDSKASEKFGHPCTKPMSFMEKLFDRITVGNETFLDPFLGSGSTLIACEKTGRKCYGMEIDEHYMSVIIKRYEDYEAPLLRLKSRHRILCGDSTDENDVSKLMAGEKADMVYTDPPYGIKESMKDHSSREKLAKPTIYKMSNWDDKIPDKSFFDIVHKMGITTIIWGGNYMTEHLKPSGSWVVWNKKMSGDFSDCELAWSNYKNAVRYYEQTWNGMIREGETGKRVHPTQKPIALAEWCFENYGEPKTVLDLFLGSGSTLIACEKTGRHCRGMELDEHYMSVIIKRWEEYTGQKAERIE